MEHFFLSSFEKIGKMTFPEPPAPQVVKIPDFFLKIFNEVFPESERWGPAQVLYEVTASGVSTDCQYRELTTSYFFTLLNSCESISSTSRSWSFSESACHTFQCHQYDVISESHVTSLSMIYLKTLKNQPYQLEDIWPCYSLTFKPVSIMETKW